MKIETFVKTSVIATAVFIVGLLMLGNGLLNQKYGIATPPTFTNTTGYQTTLNELQGNIEDETLKKSSDPGQMDRDEDTTDVTWWTYTKKSLKAVTYTISTSDDSKAAISEVGQYLNINPIILGAIITFIVISFGFALIAWWKGTRP